MGYRGVNMLWNSLSSLITYYLQISFASTNCMELSPVFTGPRFYLLIQIFLQENIRLISSLSVASKIVKSWVKKLIRKTELLHTKKTTTRAVLLGYFPFRWYMYIENTDDVTTRNSSSMTDFINPTLRKLLLNLNFVAYRICDV